MRSSLSVFAVVCWPWSFPCCSSTDGPIHRCCRDENELRSIERLIKDLLQWQTEQLTCLESTRCQRPLASDAAAAPDVPGLTSPCPPTWVSVVNGHKKLSLPLYNPFGTCAKTSHSNFLSPLAELSPEPVWRLYHKIRKAPWCYYILSLRREDSRFYRINSGSPRHSSLCPHCDSACWH